MQSRLSFTLMPKEVIYLTSFRITTQSYLVIDVSIRLACQDMNIGFSDHKLFTIIYFLSIFVQKKVILFKYNVDYPLSNLLDINSRAYSVISMVRKLKAPLAKTTPWTYHEYKQHRKKLKDKHLSAGLQSQFLVYFQSKADEVKVKTTTYIHPRPISYPTLQNKSNYSNAFADSKLQDNYQRLWKLGPGPEESKVWLALLTTWTQSWVGSATPWDEIGWHAWAAALIRDDENGGKGKHLLIWDCDADMKRNLRALRRRDVLCPTQILFVAMAEKKGKIKDIWIGGDRNRGQGRCLEMTANWIHKMASLEDSAYKGKGDSRFKGFEKLILR